MDNLEYLFDKVEPLLPYCLASLAKSDRDKSSILKVAELCQRHGIPFRAFINIITELQVWEASHNDGST